MAHLLRWFTASLLLAAIPAFPQARFDLTGPKIDIRVTRAGVTLPIAAVPNLQPGDQIWLHPDLPPTQSVHYLLIVSFLRGTTNPPPDNWFTRVETWQKKVREEGVLVTVPPDAQQALLFLAPETGGDFSTLRSAVKGRPGIFVRASQDLAEAGFEQARTEKYIASMKLVPPDDPKALAEHSNLLSRTLNLRPNPDCFKRPFDQQYTCLTQTGNQTLLDDGHAESIVATLSSGPGSDLINQASYTKLAGAGDYSAYVGAIVDFARLLNGLHTAKYQYIPAIASPSRKASTSASTPHPPSTIPNPSSSSPSPPSPPPSPRRCAPSTPPTSPASSIPTSSSPSKAHPSSSPPPSPTPSSSTPRPPPPQANQPPPKTSPSPPTPSRAASPSPPQPPPAANCPPPQPTPPFPAPPQPRNPQPTPPHHPPHRPTSAPAPSRASGASTTSPAPPSPSNKPPAPAGTSSPHPTPPPTSSPASPTTSSSPPPAPPASAPSRSSPEPPRSTGSCEKKPAPDPAAPKVATVEPVDLTLNLQHAATPGSIHLAIQQFGQSSPDQLGTRTFSEPAKIEALHLYAGDTTATLTGTSLDQVQTLTIPPSKTSPSPRNAPKPAASSTLTLAEPKDSKPLALKPGDKLSAEVHLNDGRTLAVSTTVLPPRPVVTLLSSRITPAPPSPIQLAGPADLPLGARLTFFLKSKTPFPRTEQIELANSDESLHTTLSVAAGTLVLQDAHTVFATFDPLKTFGPSTFGPFRLRALAPASAAEPATPGDWLPLATIVRLPTLTSLGCPVDPTLPCQLTGSDLYLIDSIALTPTAPVSMSVPEGFVDTTLSLPHPTSGSQNATFYLRLRDDPATLQPVTLDIAYDSPPPKQKAPGTQPSAPPR